MSKDTRMLGSALSTVMDRPIQRAWHARERSFRLIASVSRVEGRTTGMDEFHVRRTGLL